jgi:TolB-like protein
VLTHLAKLEETDEEQLALGWGISGYLYAATGQQAKAQDILDWLMKRRQNEYVPALALACPHLGLGEHDKALRWLEEAVEQRHPTAILLNLPWQWLDPVQSDPRFRELRRQMNFPPSQGAEKESEERLADLLPIRDGTGVRRANTAGPLLGPSVAVLPLENLSGDAEQEPFVDGMTDAIIANLGAIDALHVIARKSVMLYKQSNAALPTIADELGVRYIVDGAAFFSEDSVRITARHCLKKDSLGYTEILAYRFDFT